MLGYPCKSISPQNNATKSFTDETSKTGSGFKAFEDYVSYASPDVCIAENVASMVHKRKAHNGEIPIQIQNAAMRKLGYDCFFWVLNSKQFGLSQSRTRCWAIYLKRGKYNVSEQLGFYFTRKILKGNGGSLDNT